MVICCREYLKRQLEIFLDGNGARAQRATNACHDTMKIWSHTTECTAFISQFITQLLHGAEPFTSPFLAEGNDARVGFLVGCIEDSSSGRVSEKASAPRYECFLTLQNSTLQTVPWSIAVYIFKS